MNWMKHKLLYFALSACVILPGLYSLTTHGLKLSIEFTGGTVLTLNSVKSGSKTILKEFKNYSPQIEGINGNSITLKMQTVSQSEVQSRIDELKKTDPNLSLTSFESIGPDLGHETIKKTINALLIASGLLLIYISLAFKQFKFGLCAILAMFHDTAVLLGSFSLLGWFFNVQVDLLYVTAVLTILSFSVHDTIIVFDRIRELSHMVRGESTTALINRAVTETLGRSLNNSLAIIFMLLALFLLGGESTRYFALALLIGTITGTYSSTFTASPLLIVYEKLFERSK